MELSNYILISRNNVLYKAKLSLLSSIILLNDNKESFLTYLDDLSASINSLTSTFDTILYSKSEMKNDFTIKENVSNLTASGTYVLTGAAAAAANKVKSRTDLSSNTGNSWYEKQLYESLFALTKGYEHAIGVLDTDMDPESVIEEHTRTPSVEEIMDKYDNANL